MASSDSPTDPTKVNYHHQVDCRSFLGKTGFQFASLVQNQNYALIDRFELESGQVLEQVPVAYKTWGVLNETHDNVMVICHALSGSSDVEDWWGPLMGKGKAFDYTRFYIVCLNVLGSPYGTASPVTLNPKTSKPYGPEFPLTAVRDDVKLHKTVLDAIGVNQIQFVIGGSMGGMQALEWAYFGKEYVKNVVAIATSARHSAWCISWGEAQRQSIYSDPKYEDGYYEPHAPPVHGLSAARMCALLTYRSQHSFRSRFDRKVMPTNKLEDHIPASELTPSKELAIYHNEGHRIRLHDKRGNPNANSNFNHVNNNNGKNQDSENVNDKKIIPPSSTTSLNENEVNNKKQEAINVEEENNNKKKNAQVFTAQSYLRYQADKFIHRFDANCYIAITRKLDTHDVSRNRGELYEALKMIDQPMLVIGIETDGLFTVPEQQEIAEFSSNAEFEIIHSFEGHDGFLLEFDKMNHLIKSFISRKLDPTLIFPSSSSFLYENETIAKEEDVFAVGIGKKDSAVTVKSLAVSNGGLGSCNSKDDDHDGNHGQKEKAINSVFGEAEDLMLW